MNLITEIEQKKQKILIVERTGKKLGILIKQTLKAYDMKIFYSSAPPKDFSAFDYVFVINGSRKLNEELFITVKKQTQIFFNRKKLCEEYRLRAQKLGIKNVKFINLSKENGFHKEDVDQILWFSFSNGSENFLNIESLVVETKENNSEKNVKPRIIRIKPRFWIFLAIFFIILYHFIFIIPLTISSLILYSTANSLGKETKSQIELNIKKAESISTVAKNLYSFSKPTYQFFSVSLLPENLIELNEKSSSMLSLYLQLQTEGKKITEIFITGEKDAERKKFIENEIDKVTLLLQRADSDLETIYQEIPEWNSTLKEKKKKIKEFSDINKSALTLLPYVKSLFGSEKEKKYLLLFANNMEIRPGGGFIGSFAVLKTKNYSIEEFKVYDVYDADGQLIGHIEPPAPIKKYLNQPHWFLRDSGFSPDFYQNYSTAKYFLEKEMNMKEFDGGILITTTAIQNILNASGNLYIPDFDEIVNSQNFYLKAQLYSEKGFFPGSIQKKKFLSSVANQLILNSQNLSLPILAEMFKKSLDEKQIVMYFDDLNLQKIVDHSYWSGRTIEPTCSSPSKNCLVDFLFPFDANLGVNKANFFVTRSLHLDVKFSADGSIKNNLKIVVKNDSENDVFPGGTYMDYMQIYLPSKSSVLSIAKNGTAVEDYSSEDKDGLNQIGFYVKIKPKEIAEISVDYKLNNILKNEGGVYQLIIQKQIGSQNSDFTLRLTLPKNIYIVNQNFSPLVKENSIIYNTSLTADKIFFVELLKEKK